jgi:hypothetical protein
VAVTYQGDDARQGRIARQLPIHFAHEVDKNYYTQESDRNAQRAITSFDRYADLIYALNPDLLSVLPERARFQPYCSVDADEWIPLPKAEPGSRPLRVVHAPSSRAVKGTHHIVNAVGRLRASGCDIDFVLVENMSNAEARRLYETADLAIDQVLAGFYGGLAVELMSLEVPVICYLREDDLLRMPRAMCAELPLINATPATLESVLRDWVVERRSELPDRGRRAREFVRRWHNPREVAQQTLRDYERVWQSKRSPGNADGP